MATTEMNCLASGGSGVTSFTGGTSQSKSIPAIVGHRYLIFFTTVDYSFDTDDFSGFTVESESSRVSTQTYSGLTSAAKAYIGTATDTTIELTGYSASYTGVIWLDLDAQ